MPTYDYACEKCGHRFEQFQSIKDDALTTCPSCKAKRLKRLIGAGAGVIFKGAGFYQTDYRSSSYESGKKADSTTGDKSSKSDSGKSGDGGGCGKPSCGSGGCSST